MYLRDFKRNFRAQAAVQLVYLPRSACNNVAVQRALHDVEKVLPSVECERCTKIFLCMRGFRSLEKLLKLENEKSNLEKSLKVGFVKVGH